MKIFFLGISGTFMGNLAQIAKKKGFEVFGVRSWERNMFYTYHGCFFGEKGAPQYVHPPGTKLVEKLTKMGFSS